MRRQQGIFTASLRRSLFSLYLALLPLSCFAEKIIHVWSYHQGPPFIAGPGQGLTYDLVTLLNRQGLGEYRLELVIMPRKRLDKN